MLMIKRATALTVLALLPATFASCASPEVIGDVIESEEGDLRLVKVIEGLSHPWGLAFLPDDRLLVTERPGRLQIVAGGEMTEVSGLPDITSMGQGGLMDVVPHPNYEDNGWIYLTYAATYDDGVGTRLGRGRLEGNSLVDFEQLFQMDPPGSTRRGVHFGSRVIFDNDGYLFMSIGERGDRNRSQQLDSHHGTTIRLHDDGRVPTDNPFVDREDAKPEIWSYGHRNAQGMAYDPENNRIWQNEHGPRGGDKLTLIIRGANYGWPLATYGEEYRGGTIGVDPGDFAEAVYPVHDWTPSIAVSGLAFYDGDKFPGWRGNLFNGALRQEHIARLVLDGEKVVHEERLLRNAVGRIRDVRSGPDGHLWFLTDEPNGGIYRLEPAAER